MAAHARDDGSALMDWVEQVATWFEEAGSPRVAGRIVGWLLVCDPPRQSSEELADALRASAGSISTNTRLLANSGLIERTGVPGDRRAYFRLVPGAWSHLLTGQQARIAALRAVAAQGMAAVEGDPGRRDRVEQLADFAEFWDQQFPRLIEAWEARHRGDDRAEDRAEDRDGGREEHAS